MAKGFKKQIIAKKEDGVALEVEGLEFSLDVVTAVHIKADLGLDEKFTYNPYVSFYRLIDISTDCEKKEECILFEETCDMVYLPPGRYYVTMCPINSKYYDSVSDMQIKVKLIFDPISSAYKEAMNLNTMRGC